jgi:hypothetical protein
MSSFTAADTRRREHSKAMTWDMALITVTLATALLLSILLTLLSIVWLDRMPRRLRNSLSACKESFTRLGFSDRTR